MSFAVLSVFWLRFAAQISYLASLPQGCDYSARTINSPALRTDEFLFKVTIDSLFIRAHKPIDYATETDMENGYLKKLIQYQETTINASQLLDDANKNLLEQMKHRVAELESRLKYIQAHPEVIGELEPLPEFNLVVPFMQGVGDPKVYTNLTAAQKRQNKIHRKYVKKVIEPKIKKDLEDQGL